MRLTLMTACLFAGPTLAADVPYKDAASVPRSGKDDPRFRSFDELLTSFLVEQRIPGATVAVGRDGKVLYSRGFGYADLDAKRAVEPTDLFRIASISKPITAVAVLQLVEQGKLKLDEPALAQLGGGNVADERFARITVRQLLQHTGGFDRGASFDPMFRAVPIAQSLNRRPPAGTTEVIAFMGTRRLDFDPGTKYAYSNFGYCLLGRLIERASGKPYGEYVKREVLRPVGVRDAHLGRTHLDGRRTNEVRYYTDDDRTGRSVFAASLGRRVPVQYGAWHLEAMDSHGAWIASAPDLVRFAMAFDDPDDCPLLKPASIETMFAPPPGDVAKEDDGSPKAVHYGCGWSVRRAGKGLNTWHTGSLDGTSTLLVRRHDGLSWAVLFNTRDTPGNERPSGLIDPLMHGAANAVRDWSND